jgi:hypothetical protein
MGGSCSEGYWPLIETAMARCKGKNLRVERCLRLGNLTRVEPYTIRLCTLVK